MKQALADFTVFVGGHEIPVYEQDRVIVVDFEGGRRDGDTGCYGFWLVQFKRAVDGRPNAIVRSKVGWPLQERLERFEHDGSSHPLIEGRDANMRMWGAVMERGANVDHVRAATLAEVNVFIEACSMREQVIQIREPIARKVTG